MMLADELCPECHGKPEIILLRKEYLQKRCSDCKHEWFEERSQIEKEESIVREGSYIDRKIPIDSSRKLYS
jgi:hypothetical protein